MKEEANLQNENEPHPMKNETARMRLIITDCLICRISKIQKGFFKHTVRKSKTHSSQDGNVNSHFKYLFSLKDNYKKIIVVLRNKIKISWAMKWNIITAVRN